MLGNSLVPTSLDTGRARAAHSFLTRTLRPLRLPAALLFFATAGLQAADVPTNLPEESLPAARPEAVPAVLSAGVPALLARRTAGLSPKVLAQALDAVSCARARGIAGKSDVLTVIDYTLPSTQPRLWVLDLAHGKVLFHELVAHGAGSGDIYATHFSNVNDSRATSLGLFQTADTYEGGNGYSLRLKGLDAGVNDLAEERHIVMHGAWYVSADHAKQFGRLGRSWGCPALPLADAKPVIDTVKGGSFVYAYSAADATWLNASSHTCSAAGSGGTLSRAALKTAR
jgi:hypothetical protein